MRRGVVVIGCGTVGSGVVRLLAEKKDSIARRYGVSLDVVAVCDKDREALELPRGYGMPTTTNFEDVIEREEVDIVVELVGGVDVPYHIFTAAMESGKSVVSANKALLATRWAQLMRLASTNGVSMAFEASVCAGVPVVAAVRDGLASARIRSVVGIVNGTSNYVLTRMREENLDFKAALDAARREGYAEADPSLDVGGGDSAHKIAILARLAFGVDFDFDEVFVEGITAIQPADILFAEEMGFRVKLVAIAARDENGTVDVRVHPALLPISHPLAGVDGVWNAVSVDTEEAGEILFRGYGAGMMPTAVAVVSDIIDVALGRSNLSFENVNIFSGEAEKVSLKRIESLHSEYYVRCQAVDRPGVLSRISGILGQLGISIASVIQKDRSPDESVPLVMITHRATEADMRRAMEEVRSLDVVSEAPVWIRVVR